MNLRGYSLEQLETQPDLGPVWVRNTSNGERRGNVVITVARHNGIGSDTLEVPPTWIPVDLTSRVARRHLLNDNQFRQSLDVGLLTLVHPEDAAKLFETDPEARTEKQRLRNLSLGLGLEFQHETVQSNVEVFSDGPKNDEGNYPAPIVNTIQRMERAKLNKSFTPELEAEACIQLRSLGDLPEETYKWIFHKTTTLAPSVAKLAKQLGRVAKATATAKQADSFDSAY